MKLSSTVIFVNNFEKMKKFYTECLHLEIEADFGTCIGFKGGFSIWKIDPKHALITNGAAKTGSGGNPNLEICFETNNFDKDVAHVKSFDVNLIHDIHTENWGQKTIRFYDPENNMVELGEDFPTFISRLHSEGLSARVVSEKTGVPLEYVNSILRG